MSLDCDHPRPALNLPQHTPPQLGWQVPSFLSDNPLEMRRQLLAALEGIYLEQSKRFATPAIIPLFDVSYDIPPGSVLRGVADGQTINLLPPALPGGPASVTPTTFIIDDVVTPLTVVTQDANGDPVSTSIGVAGVHDFVPGEGGTYQQPPGSSGPLGSGVTSDRLLGRDSAGTGPIEEIQAGGGLEFTGALQVIRSALTGDVTASAGDGVTTLQNIVNVNHFQAVTGPTFIGRNEGTSGNVKTMTTAEATSIVDLFTDALRGAVPASGGGTTNFLRADATFAAPPDTTYTAGDGLNLVGTEFSVDAGDIAGTGLTVTSNNLNVDFSGVTYVAGDGIDLVGLTFSADVSDFAGSGLLDEGSNNLAVGAGDGITVNANDVAVNASDIAGSGLTVSSNNLNVDFSSVTYTAGDGIDLVGNQFSADVSDFDGQGLEDDGANNLRIASTAAGAGLTGGSGTALAVNSGDGLFINLDTLEVDAGDLAGQGLEDDGANNLRISTAAAGGGLGGGGGSALFVESTIDTNARVGVRINNGGSTFTRRRISFIEGSNVTLSHSDDAGSEEVDLTVSASDTTYTAGDGIDISGGNSVSADVSDFAGTGLQDDGANNLRISSSAAGNGLTGGSGSALAVGAGDGISVAASSVAVDASDLAGTGLNASSNNLNVDSSLDANARVGVRADSAGSTFTRRRINFIAGVGIDISISDDSGSEEVDVTITATGL